MTAGSKTPTRVEVAQQSWACISACPDLTLDDNGDEREWFVRVGPAMARRRLAPGDRLPLGHPLAELFPTSFVASGELANVTVLSTPSAEVMARQEADRRARLPRISEAIVAVCENCHARSEVEVILPPQPTAIEAATALDMAETLDDRNVVAYQIRWLART